MTTLRDNLWPVVIGVVLTALLAWAGSLETRIGEVEKNLISKSEVSRDIDGVIHRLERLETAIYLLRQEK